MADELYLDGQLCDMGKSKIAMTYQINDIGELQDRQSNHSNTVKLPKTPANIAILGALENINLNNRKPYTKIDARLKSSGTETVPNGFAQVKSASNYYEAVIFSGLISFFDKIKGKSIKDLNFSSLNHLWTLGSAYASRNNTTGYIWPVIDFGGMSSANDEFPIDKSAMCVFAKTIFDKIFSEAGVTYSSSFLSGSPFTKTVIACTELTTVRDKHIQSVTQFNESLTLPNLWSSPWRVYMDCDGEDVVVESFTISFRHFVYGTSTLELDAVSVTSGTGDLYIPVRFIRNDLNLSLVDDSAGNPGYIDGFPDNADIFGGDITVTVTADIVSNSDDDRNIAFHLRKPLDLARKPLGGATLFEGFRIGATLDVAGSLPDIDQGEFIKAFLQFYGLIPQPDPYTGELVIKQFQDIKNNIPVAKDWSDKLCTGETTKHTPVISFQFGKYAQVNEMRFDNDDDVNPELGKGSFTIDDETLPPYALLFTSVFSGTDNHERLNTTPHSLSHIPLLDDEGKLTNSRKPRVLILEHQTLTVDYVDGVNFAYYAVNESLPVTYFSRPGDALNLTFQNFINLYYDALLDVLTDVKFVQAYLLLTPRDIAELDHFIPIYLSFFAHYFYINKLVNFIEGEETRAELVRL